LKEAYWREEECLTFGTIQSLLRGLGKFLSPKKGSMAGAESFPTEELILPMREGG